MACNFVISTTNLAACVCVCAKFDQFLPVRFYFVSRRPENFVRIAKFPYAAFGPLFAFHSPLFVTKNNNLGCKSSRFAAVVRCSVADRQLHLNGVIRSAGVAEWYTAECSDRGSNPVQGTMGFFSFLLFAINKAYF